MRFVKTNKNTFFFLLSLSIKSINLKIKSAFNSNSLYLFMLIVFHSCYKLANVPLITLYTMLLRFFENLLSVLYV